MIRALRKRIRDKSVKNMGKKLCIKNLKDIM
jgi:hypothetical protein